MENEESLQKSFAELFRAGAGVHTGIGDDAAVLDYDRRDGRLVLAAVDQVIEDVHFVRETDPGSVARKLLMRNISDIAAMGGVPAQALVTLAMTPFDTDWLHGFQSKLADAALEYGVSVVGGDMSSMASPGKVATLNITGLVEPEKLCLRSGAKAGDALYVTGSFGRAYPGTHHLTFTPRLKEARFLAGEYTRCMMDVTDGLGKDLARIGVASGLSIDITHGDAIPRRDNATWEQVLNDGEDYELILAVPQEKCEALEQNWPFRIPLTRAGVFQAGTPGKLMMNGVPLEPKGYDHSHG